MKRKLYGIVVFAATTMVCVLGTPQVPVNAQDAEITEAPISATIAGEAIPEQAKSIEDPTIEIDDLELLVKPLTLEELQHEAAAWLLLLKNKVQQISNAEIVIKRENRIIELEQTAAQQLEEAKVKLLEAQEAQEKAQPNTPEYEEATRQIEEAKAALTEAEITVQAALKAAKELKESEALRKVLGTAEEEQAEAQAKEFLKQAKKIREDIPASSSLYRQVTPKIDALEEAINILEQAEADLKETIPNSPEFNSAQSQVNQAREVVKKATEELTKVMPQLLNETSGLKGAAIAATPTETKPAQEIGETAATIENTGSQIDGNNLNESEVQKAKQELAQASQELEKKAQEESELKNQLVANVTNLQLERVAISDRLEVILDELDSKGGDTSGYRKYVKAVSGVEIDLTDTEGLGVRLISWLQSEEGGVRLGIDIAKFSGIILASVILSYPLGMITNRVLAKVGGTSSLFREFIVIVTKRGIVLVGCLLALTSVGVSLGPILALLGGASFVLAFALQSNLGNFASGLMLLVNKPFDVGDEVKVAGYWASVDSISLANTKLKGFDGSTISLPNNTVWGSDIINFTNSKNRKLMFSLNIAFEQDMTPLQNMWFEITANHPKVLDTPAPGTFPWHSPGEDNISMGLSAWSTTDDYWGVYVDLLQSLQQRFPELGIELDIQDIRIHQEAKNINLLKLQEA